MINIFMTIIKMLFLICNVLLILSIFTLIYIIYLNIATKNTETCPSGQCPTNIYSGVKQCDTILDPSFQACNTKNACDNPRTPCLYEDPNIGTSCPGDIGYTGVCKTDNCKCLNRIYCPSFALTTFTPTTFTNPNITVYVQNTTYTDDSNNQRSDLPLSPGISGTTTTTCGISESNLANVWPSTCINGTFKKNELDGLYYCV